MDTIKDGAYQRPPPNVKLPDGLAYLLFRHLSTSARKNDKLWEDFDAVWEIHGGHTPEPALRFYAWGLPFIVLEVIISSEGGLEAYFGPLLYIIISPQHPGTSPWQPQRKAFWYFPSLLYGKIARTSSLVASTSTCDGFSLLTTHSIIYEPSFHEVMVIDTYEITFNKNSLGIHSRPSKRHPVNFTPRCFTRLPSPFSEKASMQKISTSYPTMDQDMTSTNTLHLTGKIKKRRQGTTTPEEDRHSSLLHYMAFSFLGATYTIQSIFHRRSRS